MGDVECRVPGGVYLCQIGDRFSCGACCGLYNVGTPTFDRLERMLGDRTAMYLDIPKNADSIAAFAERMISLERRRPPFDRFHHCPYLGFVDDARRRVGCLVHPLGRGNAGVDYRGLSYYGGFACNTYFCPTYARLPERMKRIVIKTSKNWYDYGMIITETDLLESFFLAVERRRGAPLTANDVLKKSSIRAAVASFLRLKGNWPHRSRSFPIVPHYFFKDGAHARPDPIYPNGQKSAREYDRIFRELVSEFETVDALAAAEKRILDIVERAAGI